MWIRKKMRKCIDRKNRKMKILTRYWDSIAEKSSLGSKKAKNQYIRDFHGDKFILITN